MDRIVFTNSAEHRKDAALAAFFCDQSSQKQDLSVMRQACRQHVLTDVHIAGLEGGAWAARHDRSATVIAFGTTIVIAFRGANEDEGLFNLCFLGKGPNFWDLHYSRKVDNKAVHSAYLDVWFSLKEPLTYALIETVEWIQKQGRQPEKILITGYSMGGGVSSLAFPDILSFIQVKWGSQSSSPQDWARDENFQSLIRHITFGEYPAGSYEWHAHLNMLYERHCVPAWEFSNPADKTFAFHIPFFKCWRGHKYNLPDRAVHPFSAEYGGNNHGMLGYWKSMQWIEQHGWGDVKSCYRYP